MSCSEANAEILVTERLANGGTRRRVVHLGKRPDGLQSLLRGSVGKRFLDGRDSRSAAFAQIGCCSVDDDEARVAEPLDQVLVGCFAPSELLAARIFDGGLILFADAINRAFNTRLGDLRC